MEELIPILQEHGHWAVFGLLLLSGVGIALGEEVVLIPAGILLGRGELQAVPTWLCGYFGVIVADLIWFAICYRYGSRLLRRRWFRRLVHPRRLLEARHHVLERGAWVVAASRFVPGSRTTVIAVSGMLHLAPWKFTAVTFGCVLLTLNLQLGLGVLIARGLGDVEFARLVLWMVAAAVAAPAVMLLARRLWRHRQHVRRPRAKARWLRRGRAKAAPDRAPDPRPGASRSPARTLS